MLKADRARLESLALRHRVMIDACLIARFLGTREQKRTVLAYYLSRKLAGKTRLMYIARAKVRGVQQKTDSWREYRVLVKRINALSRRIVVLFRQLGKMQVDTDWEG